MYSTVCKCGEAMVRDMSLRMTNAHKAPIRSDNYVQVKIVSNYEQLLHVFAVRSICFMEERGIPAKYEFDGNDYQATHVVIYAGEEPIGCSRVRWFRDFAKMERTCLRKAHRSKELLRYCANAIFAHISRKGYDRVIIHANPKLARLWRGLLGFSPVHEKGQVFFSEQTEPYVELVKYLEPHAKPITSHESIGVLFRVEGQWDTRLEYEL
jgi:predicted GNAT family N-acyltransferase